ncbi:MAG: DUF2306 domain-containing protein [Pseudomonadales bacterium]|nr:DUF2306 domain-containing protein [Pseudomonadales bacterium]
MQRVIPTFLFGLLLLTSFAIALHAVGFQFGISGDPETRARFATIPVASTLHVLGGGTVLLIGGFQFSQRLRTRYTALHRNLGRIYLILVALGGTGSLFLAPAADGGLVAKIGFFMLGVLWLFSGWQAYAAIRRRDIQTHREWMMRSFAMTFAAVTLRVYLGVFAVLEVPFDEAYPVVAWLSWVPNLILVEWYLALKRSSSPAVA